MKARGWKHAASPGKDGRPEMAYRDEMASQASKYRGQEAKRREYNEHKDTGYNAGGGRRRYDHAPSDMFRRQYGTDERVRHGRYPEREYSTESRDTRAQRGDWRSYDYDEDANYYGEARGYRGGRYDDNAKYRKSGQQYENRDRFGRGDRYDRHRRSERSYSPQTPPSDRRSPNPKRVHNAAPPPPPHEMVEGFKGGENAYSKHSRSVTGQHNGKGPAYTNDGSHSYSKHRGDVKPAEKSSQNDVKVSDPRSGRNLYISRLTTELDIVKLPRVAPADASLASPPFQMNLSWDHLKPNFNVFQTPLERINMHMCAPKPQITQEWWLKGE
ncbi:hypothetical protein X943_001883 [Babesia divergens]|uniref:Uncharacterized protein n=1 Tax=Babesia divergens TaxID=32595 RepID=A0AAD9GAI7_BABDI|nr:hypothetical protein X943_001883 [Babesia divergens]